jgi:UDP-N-acetyl-D-mannosaminuronic acid dehydrogenase
VSRGSTWCWRFNNAARYVHFAVANQFAIICDTFGADVHQVRELANYRYPRNKIALPGLTAETCLRKDFGMINEWSPYPDLPVVVRLES